MMLFHRLAGVGTLLLFMLVLAQRAAESVAAPMGGDTPQVPFAGLLTPCTVAGVPKPTFCGSLPVFEDRDAGAGRTIDIQVMVAAALEGPPEPDPLVYFEGGPGGSSINVARAIVRVMSDVRRRRDLVFIDQRGTGASARLACDTPLPSGEASLFGSLFPANHVRACATRLEARADLRLYSTPVAVDDIAEILSTLGYEAVNLFGTSYGSRVALVFLDRYESMVKTVIVNGVAPPHRAAHLWGAQNVDRSLEWLYQNCSADPRCSTEAPDLRGQMDRLLARFEHGPVTTQATLSGGTRATVRFSRGDFAYAIRGMLYGELADSIPTWVTEATSGGGWARFADYYVVRSRWVTGSFATGMHLSVFCTEDIPFVTEADIADVTYGTLLGESLIRRYQRACEGWPRGDVPPGYHELIRSSLPVLIVSGERDPVTPVLWGDEIAAAMSQSVHVVVPNAGHVPLDPCVASIQNAFVIAGSTTALDTSCVGG